MRTRRRRRARTKANGNGNGNWNGNGNGNGNGNDEANASVERWTIRALNARDDVVSVVRVRAKKETTTNKETMKEGLTARARFGFANADGGVRGERGELECERDRARMREGVGIKRFYI